VGEFLPHAGTVAGSDHGHALDKLAHLRDANRKLTANSFDIILTNPPFGAVVKEAEKGKAYLKGWELHRYTANGNSENAGIPAMPVGDSVALLLRRRFERLPPNIPWSATRGGRGSNRSGSPQSK